MSTPRRVFAFLAAALPSVLAIAVAGPAQAQLGATVTVPPGGVQHSIARGGFRTNNQVNFADCNNDDVILFGVDFTNRASYPLEIWAGNNSCVTNTNRSTTTQTGCWLLYSALPTTNNVTVQLHLRDILWGQTLGAVITGSTTSTAGTGGTADTTDAGTVGGSGGTGGTTVTGTSTVPTGTLITGSGADACIDKSGIPVVATLTVTFMLIDPSNANTAIASAPWTLKYKLLAPNPPDSVSAAVGDTLLPIHFSYVNAQANDMTINGYQFFCDPPPGAIDPDAGIAIAPVDTGLVTPSCQTSTALIDGEVADPKYKCGSASISATAGNATGLTNGVSYNVGVSATDTYDNVGKLSTLSCQVPQPITGFFKAYRAAGGTAGGGYCSFSTKPEPLPLIALLGLATCLVLRRRRAA